MKVDTAQHTRFIQAFLAKIPKLAAFSALLCSDKKTAPSDREQKGTSLFVFHKVRRFPHALRSCLLILLLASALSLTHCTSSNGGGGGGGDPAVYTCTNGTPSEGRPDGDADVEQCASCSEGYGLVDEILVDEVICREPFYLHSNGITLRCPNAADDEVGTVNGVEYTKRTLAQIQANFAIAATSCTSGISDMDRAFFITGGPTFNGDISSWDVSSVTNMQSMFLGAKDFNRDISSWDVSSVTNMQGMFNGAIDFNQNLSSWCVSGIGPPAPTSFADSTPASFTVARQPQWGEDCP